MRSAQDWLYFGCGDGAGHYLWTRNRQRARHDADKQFNCMDGRLCAPEGEGLYIAAVTRFFGIGPNGYTALAWWDRSVDKRPGSNSIIFCPSSTASPQSALHGLERFFPWVAARLPQRVILHPSVSRDPFNRPDDRERCSHGIKADRTACEPLARLQHR